MKRYAAKTNDVLHLSEAAPRVLCSSPDDTSSIRCPGGLQMVSHPQFARRRASASRVRVAAPYPPLDGSQRVSPCSISLAQTVRARRAVKGQRNPKVSSVGVGRAGWGRAWGLFFVFGFLLGLEACFLSLGFLLVDSFLVARRV